MKKPGFCVIPVVVEQQFCLFPHKKIYLGTGGAIDSEALYLGLSQQRRNAESTLAADLYYTTRYYQQQLK
ncbi:hypothetical protein [Microcoleus sp. BROC3]|uniref:hypothetical protein n=1 Tax=Microcoleus sp. BROC3 TaxID=3055323 RepID=UPI002FCFF662